MSLENPPPSLKFIQSFIIRSRELQKNDPVISYYCKYYAIQEALASQVHLTDPAAADYLTNLLDVVEKEKNQLKDRDTISDEVVAQAYVEKFATRVFAHAEKDIINKTATKLTAMNLLAAATFLELLKLFGEPDKAILDQVKYCKFHATRILRTLNAGQDPNDYEEPVATLSTESQSDLSSATQRLSLDDTSSVKSAHSNQSFTPSSPPPPPPASAPAFAPQFTPSAPPSISSPVIDSPPTASPQPDHAYHHAPQHHVSKVEVQKIVDEAERFKTAQKHARYAISALNYEDVDTAVRELKTALALLGE